MKILLHVVPLFLFQILNAQTPTLTWAKRFGGTGSFSETQTTSLATDNAGNLYFTGIFSGTVDFDPGAGVFNLTSLGSSYDGFVVKLSSTGTMVYALRVGGTGSNTMPHHIKLDATGNVYITGTSSNTADFDPGSGIFNLVGNPFPDVFICKLTNSGSFLWAKNIVTPEFDVDGELAFDAAQNPIMVGAFGGTNIDFDPGTTTALMSSAGFNDVFIWKLSVAGNYIWSKRLGGANSDEGYGIDVDAAGNIYIAGGYTGAVDLNADAGVAMTTGFGQFDVFVEKLDASGNYQWSKFIGGTATEAPVSLDVSTLNNIYVVGYFNGTVDFDPGAAAANQTSAGSTDGFVWKLSNAGNHVWASRIGGTGTDKATAMEVDNVENLFVAGEFEVTVDLNPGAGVNNATSAGVTDAYVLKLNASGAYAWSYRTGGSGFDRVYATGLDSNCDLVVAGSFQQTVDFDPGTAVVNLTAGSSSADTYIQKMTSVGASCGVLLPVELTSFTGEAMHDFNLLQWTTASELNNERFTVWQSADGKYFDSIGVVMGAGTSWVASAYTFQDGNPSHPVTYYRLEQIDFDGTSAYSQIIAVEREVIVQGEILAYPNPSDEFLSVMIPPNNTGMTIKLVNTFGIVVSRDLIPTGSQTRLATINTTQLPNGLYWLCFTDERVPPQQVLITH